MILPPPHRAAFGAGPRPGETRGGAHAARDDAAERLAARDAVTEVLRLTLLDDAARQDRRDDLAFRARARRAGFLTQAVAEITPPEPAPADTPHPGAADGARRYRAAAKATAVDGRRHRSGPPTDLSA
ncbi:hypothetical protein C882_3081 [Caenispirillum salinarum AK4]|uniref:Uncharacterized protein n=1 Tax=Caenispirillum salinarum AK4 TaxID=1238182 RepID=K9H361_9PROT|nr:hypothetical protein [Caenispirillum salinarum]EKV32017.1 hypothetical protein C882_3081 [Caenispirillum salinarum AK4]